MRSRLSLLAAVLAAAFLVPAAAQAHWELAADGHPRIAQGVPDPADLFVCPAGDAICTPVAWNGTDWRGGTYDPGPTAVGTVFELRTAQGTKRSPAWQGQVASTAPPSITGQLYGTGSAQPVAGTWTGGWGDDISSLHLSACLTPAGTGCVPLPQLQGCAVPCTTVADRTAVSIGAPAGIPPALAGRYLVATDTRLPREQIGWPLPTPALWSMGFSYDLEPVSAVRSISAPVGPLANPVTQQIGDTVTPIVPAPAVTLRERALRSKGRISVGRITCAAAACKVALKVSGGGRKAYVATFAAKRGVTAITAPARRGKLTVRVHVDGKLLASGKVTAR